MLVFAVIGLALLIAAACYFFSSQVDGKRRRQGWRGEPFEKNEYSSSKALARTLRIIAMAFAAVAVAAAYIKFAIR